MTTQKPAASCPDAQQEAASVNRFNPTAVTFVGWSACVGALAGNALIGLTIALSIVLIFDLIR